MLCCYEIDRSCVDISGVGCTGGIGENAGPGDRPGIGYPLVRSSGIIVETR